MIPKVTVSKKSNPMQNLGDALATLRKTDVLVGIPQVTSSRPGEIISNAELLYIQSKGSPARNIPARPVLEPAIQAPGNKEVIDEQLKQATIAVLHRNPERAKDYLNRAGQAASNAAKRWFFDPRNNWAPLKPATIKAKGSSQPLIDTGAMRKAITWVLRYVR